MPLPFLAHLKTHPLSRRLIFWTVLFSGALALIITVAQLTVEYRRDVDTVQQRFNLIEEGYLPSIVDTVWVADRQHLETLLDGIVRLPDFGYAEVKIDGKPFVWRGNGTTTDGLTRQWSLVRNYRERNVEIGELTIRADLAAARQRFIDRAIFIVAANFVKTVLVAFFMLALVSRLVTRHLERIAAGMAEQSGNKLGAPLALERERRDDELDRLVDAINRLHRQLADDHAKLLEGEALLERRVAQRTDELERANRELESFAYSVSHDLQAPLRAISGFSRVLLDEQRERLSPDGKQVLDRIVANAGRMSGMIGNILEYSRAGRRPLKKEQIDMTALARDIVARLRQDYPSAAVQVGDLPDAIGDATLVDQVLQNLIDNAFKYSSKTPQPVVEIGASAEDGRTFYWIRDNGAGFDMQYANKLFGVFQRLHADAEFPGTGVGLATVKRLVERHGGRTWATAEPGHGATFCFTLG